MGNSDFGIDLNISEMMCGSYENDPQEMHSPFSQEYYEHLYIIKRDNVLKTFILEQIEAVLESCIYEIDDQSTNQVKKRLLPLFEMYHEIKNSL